MYLIEYVIYMKSEVCLIPESTASLLFLQGGSVCFNSEVCLIPESTASLLFLQGGSVCLIVRCA